MTFGLIELLFSDKSILPKTFDTMISWFDPPIKSESLIGSNSTSAN